ncbi:MAG TPA: serine/threonine-protein kinase [Kofleriaceae bacterium]
MNPSTALDRDRVGPYQLVKAIGAGGSARVDLARIDRAYGFQRHVVIKRPLEHLRSDSRAADSLRREARLGGRLRHPNLVAILDAGVHDGYDYLVLEYVHGGSLRDLMQTEEGARVRDVPLEVALAIVRDVARGVHEAHELRDERGAPLGLVHRDVSPGNVLLGLDGAVKLADFGIAKETRVATLSGSMHGTVTYMAPEQCRGHAFDRRADIFSLGVILYELTTGTRLFWADNDVASLHKVLGGNVPRPRRVNPAIAPVLEDTIMTALATDPEKRFPNAKVLADGLERYGASVGKILAARSVAGWVHDTMGPRDVPWIAAVSTVVDAPMLLEDHELSETSLVALIEATPPPEDLPVPTFGPSDKAVAEDLVLDTLPSAAPVPARRDRKLFAFVIAACMFAGVVIAFMLTRQDSPTAPEPAQAETPPPTEPSRPQGVLIEVPNTGSDEAAGDEELIEMEPPEPGKPPRRKKKRSRSKPATTDKPAVVETGSAGSAAQKPPPNVEWDRWMLLPSDKKKK